MVLAFLLTACSQPDQTSQPHEPEQTPANSAIPAGQEVHEGDNSSFLKLAGGDVWAKPPVGIDEDPSDDGKPCERVSEQALGKAIGLLEKSPAVAIDASKYRQLTGAPSPPVDGTLFLLRGFSTTSSAARVKVTGSVVTVHSDALGGLHSLRRHPCIAALKSAPSEVYADASYDM